MRLTTAVFSRTILSLSVAALAAGAWAEPKGVGIDIDGMDRAVAPGDDFFKHTNGAWLRTTEIPPDRGGYGAGVIVSDRTDERLSLLIQETAKSGAGAGTEAQKIADYHASYLDEAAIESKGLAPLQQALDLVAAVSDRKALSRVLGGMLRADVDAFNNTSFYTDNLFGLWIAQDLDDTTRYLPFVLQGGLDMPDRAYYLDASPHMDALRAQCREHMTNVLKLAKVPDAAARAARVFDLEKSIAEAHAARQDSEDIKKGNNHWTRDDFDRRAPGLDWSAYFGEAGLGSQRDFVVWQPQAVTGISALVGSQPIETWKDYLVFHTVDHFSSFLPEAFGTERFAFHGTALTGTPRRRDRTKRAVDLTNLALGEAVGRLYVEKYFPPAAKARVQEIVANIQAAFARRIDALDWMAPETKARAKAKLAVLKVGVGYPDHWRDYGGLTIVRGDALGNEQRVELFEYRSALARLGQPVDRSEWVMTPQTVNAVNLPALNAMNFPAAILQPPYFDPERPLAMDYGAIGGVIELRSATASTTRARSSTTRAACTTGGRPRTSSTSTRRPCASRKQFDGYRPFPDLAVNGTLTISENIADVAGLAAAYDAYHASLGGRQAPVVAGLSGDQQFFVSFGQSWRSKLRDPLLRQQILGDGHAPNEYRADTVRNLDAWYAAFDVKPSQKLYLAPADRVKVW
jgi:predicted metalloendopeptidase